MDEQNLARAQEPSSYQKGIDNLLEGDMERFEALIWTYVLRVNSHYYSKDFPSTQIAKIIISKLGIQKSRFPIFHKVIRIILNNWREKGLCEIIPVSRSSRSKRTKEVYRFKKEGLDRIKAKFINGCIENIEMYEDSYGTGESADDSNQILKTRDRIIEDLSFRLQDFN